MAVQKHPFHLVDPSPWPIFASLGALTTTTGGVMTMHSYEGGTTMFYIGFCMILYVMFVWWRDIVTEATFQGHHTKLQMTEQYTFPPPSPMKSNLEKRCI